MCLTLHKQTMNSTEDQLLNFLVNTLTGAFSLNFGENADIDAEDIFEVPSAARSQSIAVNQYLRP